MFVTERAAASTRRSMDVPSGTLLRSALRELGVAGEGCAVFDGERPVPLDTPLVDPVTLTVVPTFSGG